MLGNDKTFHDRLSWILMLPISVLGSFAVYLAFLALEVAVEGDTVGSVEAWVSPVRFASFVFAAARIGASVAPKRKFYASMALAALYGVGIVAYAGPTVSTAACALFGGGAACWAARRLPDDVEEPKNEPPKESAA